MLPRENDDDADADGDGDDDDDIVYYSSKREEVLLMRSSKIIFASFS